MGIRTIERGDSIKSNLFKWMIPFSVLQDTALQDSLFSSAAASPAFLFLLLIIAVHFLEFVFCDRKFRVFNPFLFFALFIFLVCINLFYFIHFNFFAYGQSLLLRGAKIFFIYFFICLILFSALKQSQFSFGRWMKVAFVIANIGLMLDYAFHEEWVHNWWIHYGVNDEKFELVGFDYRPRGFSYESSTLGLTLLTTGVISLASCKRRISRLIFLVFLFFDSYFCGSKVSIPILFLSFLFCEFSLTRGKDRIVIYLFIFFLLILSLQNLNLIENFIETKLLLPFMLDIQESSSVATRFTMAISALLCALYNPFGVGFTGYVPGVVSNISDAQSIVQDILGLPLNFYEVEKYLYQSDAFAIGAKSFFFDSTIIFGLPFVIFWFSAHRYLHLKLKLAKDKFALVLLFINFISFTFYIPITNFYIAPISYGWLISRVFKS